jgi:hypothetical protein
VIVVGIAVSDHEYAARQLDEILSGRTAVAPIAQHQAEPEQRPIGSSWARGISSVDRNS